MHLFYPRRRYKQRRYEWTYDNFIVLLYIAFILIPVVHAQSTPIPLSPLSQASVAHEQTVTRPSTPIIGVLLSVIAGAIPLSPSNTSSILISSTDLTAAGNSSITSVPVSTSTEVLSSSIHKTSTTLTTTVQPSTLPFDSTSGDSNQVHIVPFKLVYLLPGAIIVVTLLALSIAVLLFQRWRRRASNPYVSPLHPHPFPVDGGRFDFHDSRDEEEKMWPTRYRESTEDEYYTEEEAPHKASHASPPRLDSRYTPQAGGISLLVRGKRPTSSLSVNVSQDPHPVKVRQTKPIPISDSFYEQDNLDNSMERICLSDEPPVAYAQFRDYAANLTPSLQVQHRPSTYFEYSPILPSLSPPLMQDLFFLNKEQPLTTHLKAGNDSLERDEYGEEEGIYDALLRAGRPHYIPQSTSVQSSTIQREEIPFSTSALSMVPNARRLVKSQLIQNGHVDGLSDLGSDMQSKPRSIADTKPLNLQGRLSQMDRESAALQRVVDIVETGLSRRSFAQVQSPPQSVAPLTRFDQMFPRPNNGEPVHQRKEIGNI
jgi:hypothetical protein